MAISSFLFKNFYEVTDMGLILFKYEEINKKHFVKLASLDEQGQVRTQTVTLQSLLAGQVKADNVQVGQGALTINGQTVTSTEKLLELLKSIGSVKLGEAAGQEIFINTTGTVIKKPAMSAAQAVQQTEIPIQPTGFQSPFENNTSFTLSAPHTDHKRSLDSLIKASFEANPITEIPPMSPQLKQAIHEKQSINPVVQGQEAAAQTKQVLGQLNTDMNRLAELTKKLNKARDDYYNSGTESMSNLEYDALYDELEALEKKLNYSLPDSPTKNIGANVKSTGNTAIANRTTKQGTKVAHEEPALSLDKTKDVEDLKALLGERNGVLSVKMDGLTVVLTYEDGALQYAVTRGNGVIGEVITDNAKNMIGVPQAIPYKGKLVVRGEAYITYSDFNQINQSLPAGVEPFKNPRNLAAGTLRSFDKPKLVAQRHMRFCAFEIVNLKDIPKITLVRQMLQSLKNLGFTDVVKHTVTNAYGIADSIEMITSAVKSSDIPADGLVLRLDDLEYGLSLGTTGKFPRHSMAFKWQDTEVETYLRDIDWTVGRTGIVTPTAIFDPVDIEGSTISRASLHNLSIMEQMLEQPYVGQKTWVYKANLIIPQVARAEHNIDNVQNNRFLVPPTVCPKCGHNLIVKTDKSSGVKTLWCSNKECSARGIAKWEHFVSRDAMNIDGISTAILQDMLDVGIIDNNFSSLYEVTADDLFMLQVNKEGYGEVKLNNIANAITASRKTSLERVLFAVGIPLVGLQTAKKITKLAKGDVDELTDPVIIQKILMTDGLGQAVATSYQDYMMNHLEEFFELVDHLELEAPKQTSGELDGLTFCCTGAVLVYRNREELQASIESRGGKFTSAVSSKTNYLITNDTGSGSKKNRTAQQLGIPIISEQQFIDQFGK